MAALEKLLEEERQKSEDLQFRIDEATICGGNDTVYNYGIISFFLTKKNFNFQIGEKVVLLSITSVKRFISLTHKKNPFFYGSKNEIG